MVLLVLGVGVGEMRAFSRGHFGGWLFGVGFEFYGLGDECYFPTFPISTNLIIKKHHTLLNSTSLLPRFLPRTSTSRIAFLTIKFAQIRHLLLSVGKR